jgi:hypothetical protein
VGHGPPADSLDGVARGPSGTPPTGPSHTPPISTLNDATIYTLSGNNRELRHGEAVALKREDVDLDDATLAVRPSDFQG